MASDKGGLQDSFDERLAAARDSALIKGEKVIAQEEGDQGQGIVLTDSRVLVIKVGFAATGTSQGSVIGAFPIRKITAVNLRKGPLGEVIQICADRKEPPAEAGAHPDNVVVFTGSQRMKRCEAIAAELECLIGKPISRSDPRQPQVEEAVDIIPEGDEKTITAASATECRQLAGTTDSPATDAVTGSESQTVTEDAPRQRPKRAGRPAVSLADEMFAEMMQSQSETVQEKTSVPARTVRKPAAKPVEPTAVEPPSTPVNQQPTVAREKAPEEPSEHYAPNPNLPQPVHRGRGRLLLVFAVLGAALITGIAIVAPMRARVGPSSMPAVVDTATTRLSILRRQTASVERYLASCRVTVQRADRALATFDAAAKSGNLSAIASAAKTEAVGDAWHKLSSTPAPRGLAGAREQMVSGMFIAKNALANAAGAESSTGVTPQEALKRTHEARVLINRGLSAVVALRDDLHNQIQRRAKAKPSQ